jgi:RNA polymerase sigma-70 factor, ECF subfamily
VGRYLGNSDDVDDVLQEALSQVARSLSSFRGESVLSTWIHGICARVAWSHLRRRRELIYLATPPEAPGGDGPERFEARAALAALEEVLASLGPAQRMAFVMHDVEGMGAPEIARLLEIPEGTVNSRLRDAREAVRDAMKRFELDPSLEERRTR